MILVAVVPIALHPLLAPRYERTREDRWVDTLAWHATHVVVASEGNEIDGHLEVVESWRGDLAIGDRIDLPELAAFEDEDLRRIVTVRTSTTPSVASGKRMILFLRNDGTSRSPAWSLVAPRLSGRAR